MKHIANATQMLDITTTSLGITRLFVLINIKINKNVQSNKLEFT